MKNPPPATPELPSSDEAERSVLGAILVDPTHVDEVRGIVTPSDFYRPVHQTIFRSMVELSHAGQPIDLLTLAERHVSDGALEAAGGPSYLSHLMDGIPRLMNVPHYARIVLDRSARRRAIRLASDISAQISDVANDTTTVIEQSVSGFEGLLSSASEDIPVLVGEEVDRFLQRTYERESGTVIERIIPTGLAPLDRVIGGLVPGRTYVIAARPGVGKSSMMICVARNTAIEEAAMIFSIEMPRSAVIARLVAIEAQVNLQYLLNVAPHRRLNEREWIKMQQAEERLRGLHIIVEDKTPVSVEHIKARYRQERSRRRKAKLPQIRSIWVDYVGLLDIPAGRTRAEELSRAILALREMAKREEIALVLLAQLRRPDADSFSRKTGLPRSPRLQELKDTGGLEEHPDVVILLDRAELHLEEQGKAAADHAGKVWCRVAKNRHGPTGLAPLKFWKEYTLFTEPEKPDDEDEDAPTF